MNERLAWNVCGGMEGEKMMDWARVAVGAQRAAGLGL